MSISDNIKNMDNLLSQFSMNYYERLVDSMSEYNNYINNMFFEGGVGRLMENIGAVHVNIEQEPIQKFTLADVSQKNTEAEIWVYDSEGAVYDMTGFSHPGGLDKLLSIGGKNITNVLSNIPAHLGVLDQIENIMKSRKIGIIKDIENIQTSTVLNKTPKSIEDVQGLILNANNHGKNLHIGGTGYSWNTLLDPSENTDTSLTSKMLKAIKIDKVNSTVVVQTGVIVKSVQHELAKECLMLDGLPALAFVSIGGLISTSSHSCGNRPPLSYHILEFEVVTGDGVARIVRSNGKSAIITTFDQNGNTVYPDESQFLDGFDDLFSALQCGLGMIGFIVSVKFKAFPLLKIKRKVRVLPMSTLFQDSTFNNKKYYVMGYLDIYSRTVILYTGESDGLVDRSDKIYNSKNLDDELEWSNRVISYSHRLRFKTQRAILENFQNAPPLLSRSMRIAQFPKVDLTEPQEYFYDYLESNGFPRLKDVMKKTFVITSNGNDDGFSHHEQSTMWGDFGVFYGMYQTEYNVPYRYKNDLLNIISETTSNWLTAPLNYPFGVRTYRCPDDFNCFLKPETDNEIIFAASVTYKNKSDLVVRMTYKIHDLLLERGIPFFYHFGKNLPIVDFPRAKDLPVYDYMKKKYKTRYDDFINTVNTYDPNGVLNRGVEKKEMFLNK